MSEMHSIQQPHLDRYELKKLIGKGGMGEVFLAYDPICERNVALKKIRSHLLKFKNSRKRFIQEAKIAAKLSHPSIIPIFDIVQTETVYYTMPFIEGESLRDILLKTLEGIKQQQPLHPLGNSIFSLAQVFLNVCQAIAFAHNQGILHRDLKPSNIMIGEFGQVLILDWGLAKEIADSSQDEELPIDLEMPHLTQPGKAVGTLSYLAPERALGQPASIQTDIYSLGVVLYQLLTLKLPFKRQSLADFKQTAKYEQLIDPIEMAPNRDIPIQLALIARKCLHFSSETRYSSCHALIKDLENYIEGKPDWIFQKSLEIKNPKDWEFQENVLLSPQLAITRSSYMMQWVALMISKSSFSGNLRIVIDLEFDKYSHGIGLLFSIPEKSERTGLEDGFCFWAGTKKNPGFKLFRSHVELLSYPEQSIKPHKKITLTIEKIDNRVKVFIDEELLLNYIAYIPIVGTHIGLLSKDTEFTIHSWKIFTGSQNAMVNCLSVPDAFLACREFKKAYTEYQRIAESFRGRNEGREALFRAGITLLEEAKVESTQAKKYYLCDLAHAEFENLRNTNGAPLEYLGKSLIYKFLNDTEEEVKCLELALRKFPKNPLASLIKDQLIFRLHESAKIDRKQTYLFALLALRFIPYPQMQKETKSLLNNIEQNLDTPIFLKSFDLNSPELLQIIQIAFYLNKPTVLIETTMKKDHDPTIKEALFSLVGFCLLYLNQQHALNDFLNFLDPDHTHLSPFHSTLSPFFSLLNQVKVETLEPFQSILNAPVSQLNQICALHYLICFHLFDFPLGSLEDLFYLISDYPFEKKWEQEVDILKLTLLLRQKKFESCFPFFNRYAAEIKLPLSPFFTLHSLYCLHENNEKFMLEEFKKLFQLPNPPLFSLFAHFLSGYINLKKGWIKTCFFYEKIELMRQLEFVYFIQGKRSQALFYRKKLDELTKESSN